MNSSFVRKDISKLNRQKVYKCLRDQPKQSRNSLATKLCLSLPTINKNIETLLTDGLIQENEPGASTGGRRAMQFSIVADARISIGIDVTQNHISIIAVNLNGEIVAQKRILDSYSNTPSYLQMLAKHIHELIASHNIDRHLILGVGIGLPALTTPDNRNIFYGKILGNTGLSASEFERSIPYPCIIINDANASSTAELWKRKQNSHAFCLMLSNNVGGSVIFNGAIYNGDDWHAGEIGHLIVVPNGKDCYCGQSGCLDAYLAATELSKHYGDDLNAFFSALSAQDKKAILVWEKYTDFLALAIRNLRILFDCSIILSGYVGTFLDPYFDKLKEKVWNLNTFDKNTDFIETCVCKTEPIAYGAAIIHISKFLDSFF